MSEETNDASKTIPLVVLWSVAGNAIMLLIVGITFIFCLGDLNSVLNSPTGQPMIQVFYNATQSVAGTSVMVAVVIVIFMSACVGQVATSSRQMWSFARDQGTYSGRYCHMANSDITKLSCHDSTLTDLASKGFRALSFWKKSRLVTTSRETRFYCLQ